MPTRNIYFALIVVFVSLFIASKTSLKNQILSQVSRQLEKNSLERPTREQLFQGALKGMATAVGDEPYTDYIPPSEGKEYMREIQGQFAGVGLGHFLKEESTGGFYFVPLHDSPAIKAGLKFGDLIVSVDDREVANLSIVELTGLLRGKEKTDVRIKILDRDSNPRFLNPEANSINDASPEELKEIVVTRDLVQQDPISGDRLDSSNNWIFTLKDRPDIGYIRIESFIDTTGKKTQEALEQLEREGVSKVVLDFRGNPGGFLPDASAICNELLSNGSPIVETRNRNGVKRRITAKKYPRRRFRVAVLIDSDSASASEIVAAALQDAGVGTVVGTRSYGKGTIQEIFELPCNSGVLRMTTASFWRPSGASIHRHKDSTPEDDWGVKPNDGYEVSVTPAQQYYLEWVRKVRSTKPDASELNARTFAFMTRQTEGLLRQLREGQGLTRLEAAFELGIDPSEIGSVRQQSETEAENDASSTSTSFKPLGLSPYFDPQLDRAVEYLSSLENGDGQNLSSPEDKLEIDDGGNRDIL